VNSTIDTSYSGTKLVATDGSALYYALLYAEQHSATRVLETLQFIKTLSSTLNDVTEHSVAEKKIHWWHEELTRLSQQQPRHPACVAVNTYLHSKKSLEAGLAILTATATERYASFTTEHELNETILADYGARLLLLETAMATVSDTKAQTNEHPIVEPINFHAKSELLANNTVVSAMSKIDSVALGLGQFDRLHSLAIRLRCGYPVFSDERYKEHGLSPEDLLNPPTQPSADITENQNKVRTLIASAVDDALDSAEIAADRLAEQSVTTPAKLTVQILCQIRHAQLKLWKKRTPNLLKESVTLTPLRKFIIAYRCKRRFKPI